MLDIANHIIAREGLGMPNTYREALTILCDRGILPLQSEPPVDLEALDAKERLGSDAPEHVRRPYPPARLLAAAGSSP